MPRRAQLGQSNDMLTVAQARALMACLLFKAAALDKGVAQRQAA